MIQAPLSKPIETKAPAKAEVVSNKKLAIANKEVDSSEQQEFSKELDKELEKVVPEVNAKSKTNKIIIKDVEGEIETEPKVKPVQVSMEQTLDMPSTLVGPTGSVETTSPKIFDPALTKGVEQLIQPKTTEAIIVPASLTDADVLELANSKTEATKELKAELTQTMLKTPQVSETNGRSPAIEFAPSEIDPQLLNNEDFVLQKNTVPKKSVPNAYGMKVLPQQQKLALEAGLTASQVVKETNAAGDTGINSQQFILNMMNEQKSVPGTETQAAPKVFDMNQVKSSEPNKIMTQITDYIVQAKAAKEPTVNMRVNHEQLGMLDITVSKSGVGQENIAISIGAHTMDGKAFFQQNSKDLLTHMSSAGLNVTDMKVETPSQMAKNDFDFGSQSGRNQQGSEKQFGSESNQRRHDQERRQDLWKLLNQEAA